MKCPHCGQENKIVNQCGCDLQNLPTVPQDQQTAHDQAMLAKGYHYRLTPTSGAFEPLYVKGLIDIGPLMRSYPQDRFAVAQIG